MLEETYKNRVLQQAIGNRATRFSSGTDEEYSCSRHDADGGEEAVDPMRGGNHKTNLQEKNGDEGAFKREKTEKDKERDGRGLRREKKGKVGRERGEREKIEVEAGRRRYKSGRRSGRFNPRIS